MPIKLPEIHQLLKRTILSQPLQWIDKDRREARLDLGVSKDAPVAEPLPPGQAFRLHTPWGQIFEARFGKAGFSVTDERLHPRALPWALFDKTFLDRAEAEEIREPQLTSSWGHADAFWTQNAAAWTRAEQALEVEREFYRVGQYFFGRLIVRAQTLQPRWVRVYSAVLLPQVIALPPVPECEVIIIPDFPAAPKLRVTVLSREPITRAVSGYVDSGDLVAAKTLLRQHARTAFDPGHYFFHLLASSGGNQTKAGQSGELHALAADIPDGYVADAWTLFATPKPDHARIRRLLLGAVDRGIPLWPVSLQRMYRSFQVIHQLHPEDQETTDAMQKVNRYVLAAMPAMAVSFFAHQPEQPLSVLPRLIKPPTPRAPQPRAVRKPRKRRKRCVGTVSSAKMIKTIVVKIERRYPHPLFKKIVKATKKLYAHDEDCKARVGDLVLLEETRPLSKTKRWRLLDVLQERQEDSQTLVPRTGQPEPDSAHRPPQKFKGHQK